MSDLIKELLALSTPQAVEGEVLEEKKHVKEHDFDSALDDVIDAEELTFNGSNAGSNLESLVGYLDSSYDTLEDFFQDNPGAVEAILDWIREQAISDWEENLKSHLVDIGHSTEFDYDKMYNTIAKHIGAKSRDVHDFFEGGDGSSPEFKEMVKELESSGYDTEDDIHGNTKWFKMLGFDADTIDEFDEYIDGLDD